ETGDPVRILPFLSSAKVRQSGRVSRTLSDDTKPHLLHAISPDSGSVIRTELSHFRHTIEVCITMIRLMEELEEFTSCCYVLLILYTRSGYIRSANNLFCPS